jgi:hypothetical protein
MKASRKQQNEITEMVLDQVRLFSGFADKKTKTN